MLCVGLYLQNCLSLSISIHGFRISSYFLLLSFVWLLPRFYLISSIHYFQFHLFCHVQLIVPKLISPAKQNSSRSIDRLIDKWQMKHSARKWRENKLNVKSEMNRRQPLRTLSLWLAAKEIGKLQGTVITTRTPRWVSPFVSIWVRGIVIVRWLTNVLSDVNISHVDWFNTCAALIQPTDRSTQTASPTHAPHLQPQLQSRPNGLRHCCWLWRSSLKPRALV